MAKRIFLRRKDAAHGTQSLGVKFRHAAIARRLYGRRRRERKIGVAVPARRVAAVGAQRDVGLHGRGVEFDVGEDGRGLRGARVQYYVGLARVFPGRFILLDRDVEEVWWGGQRLAVFGRGCGRGRRQQEIGLLAVEGYISWQTWIGRCAGAGRGANYW